MRRTYLTTKRKALYIRRAKQFIFSLYKNPKIKNQLNSLTQDDIHWSNTCRFAKFRKRGFRIYKRGYKYTSNRDKPIRIQTNREVWHTYKRKTIGLTADCLSCEIQPNIELQLIHELTHIIQYIEGRNMSEVETTRNEIEYANKYYPDLYNKLKVIK